MKIKNDECRMQNYDGERLINNRWTEEEFDKVTDQFLVVTFSVLLIITGICGVLEACN